RLGQPADATDAVCRPCPVVGGIVARELPLQVAQPAERGPPLARRERGNQAAVPVDAEYGERPQLRRAAERMRERALHHGRLSEVAQLERELDVAVDVRCTTLRDADPVASLLRAHSLFEPPK